jgi:hypothetical protein
MRALVVVVLLVACSKKEQTPAEPEVGAGSGSAVSIDAAPPPTEIEGIPVAIAVPESITTIQEVVIDAERVYVIGRDVAVWSRDAIAASAGGGAPKVLVDVEVDESSGKDAVNPSNEQELARMSAGNPDVARAAEAMRSMRTYEYAKYYVDGAVHGGYVYLSNMGTEAKKRKDATVERVPVAGGPVELLTKDVPGGVADLFVDDAGVWIVTHENAIVKMSHAGGALTSLWKAPVVEEARYEIVMAGDSFFVAESTLNKDFAHENAMITRVPKASGTKAKVVVPKLPSSVNDLVADGTTLYWLDGKQTGVYRVNHAGTQKPKLAVKGYGEKMHVAGKHLFRIVKDDKNDDYLARAPLAGGVEERLRKLPKYTGIVEVDDSAVWLVHDGYILRHAL